MTTYYSQDRTYYADISDATQYTTVYRARDDKPVATLTRARVLSSIRTPSWELHDTTGKRVYSWKWSPVTYQALMNTVERKLSQL